MTTDDLPVFEPTDEEIERECPELAAARRLHAMLAARYGTGAATRGSEPCPSPGSPIGPSGPGSDRDPGSSSPGSHSDTDEPIFAPTTDEPISAPLTDEPISELPVPTVGEFTRWVEAQFGSGTISDVLRDVEAGFDPTQNSCGRPPAGPDTGRTARGHPGGPAP
jgi:hypothetical protein